MSSFKKSCFFTLALALLMHSSSAMAMLAIPYYLWQGAQYGAMIYGGWKATQALNQHVGHLPAAQRPKALLAEGTNKVAKGVGKGAHKVVEGAHKVVEGAQFVKDNWTAPLHGTGEFFGKIVKEVKDGYKEGLDPSKKPTPEEKSAFYKKTAIVFGACALTAVTFWYLYKHVWNGRIPLLYRKPHLAVLSEANVEQLIKLYRDSYLLTPNHTPTFLASVKEHITDAKAHELAYSLGIYSAQEVQNFIADLENNALKSEKQVITSAILEQTVHTFRKAA